MLRESDKRIRRTAAYAAVRWAGVWWRETAHRARVYLRIAEDDPPEHPARPPCTLKIRQWAIPPPHTIVPQLQGRIRAGPPGPVRVFCPKEGDG